MFGVLTSLYSHEREIGINGRRNYKNNSNKTDQWIATNWLVGWMVAYFISIFIRDSIGVSVYIIVSASPFFSDWVVHVCMSIWSMYFLIHGVGLKHCILIAFLLFQGQISVRMVEKLLHVAYHTKANSCLKSGWSRRPAFQQQHQQQKSPW